MKQDGHTVLLTTHNLDEAEQLCDRIAIIDHGRVIAAGSPGELMARSAALPRVSIVTARTTRAGLLCQIVPDIDAAARRRVPLAVRQPQRQPHDRRR